MHTLSLDADRRIDTDPRDRRPCGRHRDRLRRHDPPARGARIPTPRWTGSCSAPTVRGRTRPAAARPTFLGRVREHAQVVVKDFRDALPPVRRRHGQGAVRAAEGDRDAPARLHAPAARPASGPPTAQRADVEHVPRSPDPRVRDPEVRRRPRRAERLRPTRRGAVAAQGEADACALRDATRQAVVHGGSVPLAHAAAGDGGNSPTGHAEAFYCRKVVSRCPTMQHDRRRADGSAPPDPGRARDDLPHAPRGRSALRRSSARSTSRASTRASSRGGTSTGR